MERPYTSTLAVDPTSKGISTQILVRWTWFPSGEELSEGPVDMIEVTSGSEGGRVDLAFL